ncbi:hypothetical protein N7474_003474 [Penicillium riverlandense]|uniref:uncharacterized protein n=1 Tax=Penicillium riverlandense TaxID=1903569 RepID=UPI002547C87D|nr:uncharacterized protein N7474_003474 [Penicillium riverlandense]KAJ5826336.1 hypothetical protein N7474_003474 [Penicillium riverlandense]
MFYFILYVVSQLVLLGAWVSGMLDQHQKKLQEILLGYMGETKVSYGMKKSLASKKFCENKDLSKLQDQLGNQLGATFGKGGVGEELGSTLSKAL